MNLPTVSLASRTGDFARRETPFYYYDTNLLAATLAAIKEAAPEDCFHVHYAIKANANPALLRPIARAGLGADCVSGGEIEAAVDAGFPPEKIVYAGVGKSNWEIELALRLGIGCFNVESLPELEVVNDLAAKAGTRARVAFRINPDIDAHTHAKITTGLNENKFGIAMNDMVAAIRAAQTMPATDYVGLHFHIGSQITETAPFAALAARTNELQNRLERAGITTRSINVGGGLGIDYDDPEGNPVPDFAGYFDTFRRNLHLRPGQELHFELGRSIVGQCGSLISRVLYVKQGATKQFLIVDAGFTELIRPAMYRARHLCQNLTAAALGEEARYDIVGPICESSDVFEKDARLPRSQRGDLVCFRSAGAYGEAMASTYNCRRLPPSYTAETIAASPSPLDKQQFL